MFVATENEVAEDAATENLVAEDAVIKNEAAEDTATVNTTVIIRVATRNVQSTKIDWWETENCPRFCFKKCQDLLRNSPRSSFPKSRSDPEL